MINCDVIRPLKSYGPGSFDEDADWEEYYRQEEERVKRNKKILEEKQKRIDNGEDISDEFEDDDEEWDLHKKKRDQIALAPFPAGDGTSPDLLCLAYPKNTFEEHTKGFPLPQTLSLDTRRAVQPVYRTEAKHSNSACEKEMAISWVSQGLSCQWLTVNRKAVLT